MHGAVAPLHEHPHATDDVIAYVRARARVPIWVPSPVPTSWTVTGLAWAGDERADDSVARAVAVALSGPAPLGGAADMVVVAEEPGTGLGAGYGGLTGPDPGRLPEGAPHATVRAAGHTVALWSVTEAADRAVFVGEAFGVWLWIVLWPAAAGHLFAEDVILVDLRADTPPDLVRGAPSPYLRPGSGLRRYGDKR